MASFHNHDLGAKAIATSNGVFELYVHEENLYPRRVTSSNNLMLTSSAGAMIGSFARILFRV
jgi:hypothetical protein